MNEAALAAFKEHAAAEFPREACGLLVDGAYVPCRNIAATPSEHFVLDPADYLAATKRGKIQAVCHTHPNTSPEPSEADRTACEATKLPWHILSWPSGAMRGLTPCGYKAPLLERVFVHGVHDCYALIRDYYEQVLSIELPDFDRRDGWWEKGENLYTENFAKAGFVQAAGLEKHDVIVMQVRSPVPNHAAVYIGDTRIMHHLWGHLSKRDVYGGMWLKHTSYVLRHRSLL